MVEQKKNQWLSKIRAIGWDLDGTLYPSNERMWSEILELIHGAVSAKFSWSPERTKIEYSKVYQRLGSNTKALNELGLDGEVFFRNVWERLDLAKYIKKDKRIIRLFAGFKDKRLFLISNANPLSQIKRKLGLIGLPVGVFEFILDTVTYRALKPDPKLFLVALDRLVLEPERVLFVGDKVTTDIRGAKSVGMRTCLVYGKSPEADINLPNVHQVGSLFL